MGAYKKLPFIILVIGALLLGGCGNRSLWGGAAVGAAAAGGAYEYQNKQAMDQLEEAYQAGEISREEYERRKAEIEGRSVVY